uniref:E3 SUMO-protein ligase PIAS2 n=1 Tax=Eptatretus burgeri TaxID=7764 RepID=A0A8C4R1C9_EPTBU
MSDLAELKHMVMTFRITELQVLLGFMGQSRTGRKRALQTAVLQALEMGCTPAIHFKIRELHRHRYPRNMLTAIDVSSALSSSSPLNAGAVSGSDPPLSPTQLHQSSNQQQTSPSHRISDSFQSVCELEAEPVSQSKLPLNLKSSMQDDELSRQPLLPQVAPPVVTLVNLPFYDIVNEIVQPTSLDSKKNQQVQEASLAFILTPQQVSQIIYARDLMPCSRPDCLSFVHLRFCLSETSCAQVDHHPPNLTIKVNGKFCPLPGSFPPKIATEIKKPSQPIDVTSYMRLVPSVTNLVTVCWMAESCRSYSMAVHLVKRLYSPLLLSRLKSKGIRNADHSKALIKEKLKADPESEVATTSLRVSLLCPLGKMRLVVPCRAFTCTHLQCFDAELYLQMNERKATWNCPVCNQQAPYESLFIDGLFVYILKACLNADEIQFDQDGNWRPKPKMAIEALSSAAVSCLSPDALVFQGKAWIDGGCPVCSWLWRPALLCGQPRKGHS